MPLHQKIAIFFAIVGLVSCIFGLFLILARWLRKSIVDDMKKYLLNQKPQKNHAHR
jgi:hypothetical protein